MSVDTTWYHGRISRPDAEQRLIAHPPSKVNALHSVQTYHFLSMDSFQIPTHRAVVTFTPI